MLEEGARATVLTVEAAHQFLLNVVEARPGLVNEYSQLCQAYKRTASVTECKLVDKLRALELSMKLQGKLRESATAEPKPATDFTLPPGLLELIRQKRRAALDADRMGVVARDNPQTDNEAADNTAACNYPAANHPADIPVTNTPGTARPPCTQEGGP
jgi:hypothetical protein